MIKELQKQIHENAIAKGFWEDGKNIPTALMLIVSEISEAMEADRKDKHINPSAWNNMDAYKNSSTNSWMTGFECHIKDTFEDELADAVIRILDLAERMNVDLESHIKAKMRYNSTREYRHGKKY